MFSRNISAAILLVLMLVSVRFGNSKIVELDCRPAVGNISENVNINCSIKINSDARSQNYIIYMVELTKMDQVNPLYTYHEGSITGDARFQLPTKYAPSLMLSNITLSDEGEYNYLIDTSRGHSNAKITLNVTKPYNLKMNSWPKVIVEDKPVDLYCNANGGYPAATIQWFDQHNTDWTRNSALHITKQNDGLFNLSSRLSFQSFDPILGEFKCVVSSRYREEFNLALHFKNEGIIQTTSNSRQIFAPIVVIGSLIVGLLMVLIYTRRRSQQRNRRPSTVPILSDTSGANNTDAEEGGNSQSLLPM